MSQQNDFPTLVYIGYGPHSRAGGTYDYVAVSDQDELNDKLACGWYATLPEAISANDTLPEITPPPTSKEPEAKVKKLNIKPKKEVINPKPSDLATQALAEG
jgi:hypothetical protein